ncbi:LPS-induced tumor necrosis factor alpha factor [Penicillium alfredii]|uniref:LPS-induced tumor necrosis factor alpha factor n=1 Tax=Penicillium alfredii TaxID=1506179 RepID=A0A9W9K3P7_9EURO|nr:LPS-induced tumor necrosis factor alpha factor [Penicillium alfredii]KAJ5091963.1 LPS-induced tumor necrosis factor alpha factor [Penicillium alfredii]
MSEKQSSTPAPPYTEAPAPQSQAQQPIHNEAPQAQPAYSEAPEAVFPTPVSPEPAHTQPGQPIPSSLQAGQPIQSPVSPEPGAKAYPGQPTPDQLSPAPTGQAQAAYPTEKSYPGQPVAQAPPPNTYYTPFGQPTGYATVAPLHALQSAPSPVDCPVCGQREMTRTEAASGMTTHGWAAVLCFCCCLGCIPYLMTSLKDVDHFCGKCGAKLAKWHNSGHVDVLQGGQPQGRRPQQPQQPQQSK